MKKIIVMIVALFLFSATSAYGDVAQRLNYQGRLTDSNGVPLADGNYTMIFEIYNALTGGTLQWDQAIASVPVADGLFSAELGSVTDPLSVVNWNQDLWIQVTVSGTVYAPRQRLTGTAYALTVPEGSITAAKMMDGATLSEIADDDGSGSGLDADLLDGHDTSYFMTSTTDNWVNITGDTMTGTLTMSGAGIAMGNQSITNAGTIEANTIQDNDDSILSINDNLAVAGEGIFTQSGERVELVRTGDTNNAGIEIRDTDGDGLTPYLDLSNDASTDYDARLILTGDDTLQIQGANLYVAGDISASSYTTLDGRYVNVPGDTMTGYLNFSGTSGISMGDEPFYLRSSNGGDANHGMIYNATIDGPEFRAYSGFIWKNGTTGATERMRLDGSGNLGVGTTPSEKLHVNGNFKLVSGDETYESMKISMASMPSPAGSLLSDAGIVSDYGASSSGIGLILQTGYGTDMGGIKITDDGVAIWGAADDDLLRVIDEDSSTIRLQITNSGYVGIGTNTTSNPAALFDVRGAAFLGGSNVNSRIKFTDAWSGYPDSTTGSEISNDTGTYKTLMIIGNKSYNSSFRRVSVWDRLEINGPVVSSHAFAARGIQSKIGPGTGADNQWHQVDCDAGYAITNFTVFVSGSYMDGNMTIMCENLGNLMTSTCAWTTPTTNADNTYHNAYCPSNALARGIKAYANAQLDYGLSLNCCTTTSGSYTQFYDWIVQGTTDNNNDDTYLGVQCPAGTYLTDIGIYAASYLDGNMTIRCGAPAP